eukprot:TRINITY_DN4863_c0_g1_i2.p1 TRINITY_DN4863_c0_g1~~TRINITY_DN4863_c0_g1_i2.p1  ORF type:complete len:232 (-),score=49.18 TRINITY_DN4863_c0_g1_i2:291-986(-)
MVRRYFNDVHNTMWVRGSSTTSNNATDVTNHHPTWSIPLHIPTPHDYSVEITLLATLRHCTTGTIAAQADVMRGVLLINNNPTTTTVVKVPLKALDIISGGGVDADEEDAVATLNIVHNQNNIKGQNDQDLMSAISSSFKTPTAAIAALHDPLVVTPFDENPAASVMSSPRSQRCSLSPSPTKKQRRQPAHGQEEDTTQQEAVATATQSEPATDNHVTTSTNDDYEEEDEL